MLTYISPKGEQEVKKFAYVGNNLSLSYAHIWGPLADFALDYVPEWVAPNVLTMGGFLCVLIAHVLIMVGGDFGEPIPPMRLFVFGVLLLIYQTLDNLDGKQARKTRSSSPIGMLFDHGSDCISSFMIGVSVLRILAVTDKTIVIFIIITHVLSVFFTCMWNQFHTFNFELGMINPVDDGIPTVALLAIGNCFLDHSMWNTNFAVTTLNVDLLLFLLAPLILLLYNINKNIFKLSKHSFEETVIDLAQPLMIVSTLVALVVLGPNNFFNQAFYPLLYSLAFLWSRNINIMQVAFISKSSNNIFNYPTLLFVSGYIGFIINAMLYGDSLITSYNFAMGMLCVMFLFYVEFVLSVISQMKRVLKINLFDLNYLKVES